MMLETLAWRGLLADSTDSARLNEYLRQPRRCYIGFDPTADSLTIGNLVPIMMLRHMQLQGHTPVVVMGGGTGLIGDPSGKNLERQLLNEEDVRRNVESQRLIFEKLLDFSGSNSALIFNNLDWLGGLGFIQGLRDIGKYMSVNEMMRRDAVRTRLDGQEQGLSYTEFSYSLLQAYDFAHLYQAEDVTIQMGGSDQWGNIVAGMDLIRKLHGGQGYGLTAPLITKEDGTKFGKSESGAIWLTPDRTSAYTFYQYLYNISDIEARKFNRMLSQKSRDEIEGLELVAELHPADRVLQTSLATELTDLIHGQVARIDAQRTADAIFKGDVSDLPRLALLDAFESGFGGVYSSKYLSGEPADFLDLLIEIGLTSSRSNARTLIKSGGIAVNGKPLSDERGFVRDDLLHREILVIRRGKKTWYMARFE